MTRYQIAPLIVFLATLLVVALFAILKLPEPAVLLAILGGFAQMFMASVSNKTNVAAAKASLVPPPLPPEDKDGSP